MSISDSTQSTSALPLQDVAGQQHPMEGLTPLEFAARVYNRLLIFFTIYVLSLGPMYWEWMDSMHLQKHPAVARFYYPLLLLCENIPPFGDLINWYLSLWWG